MDWDTVEIIKNRSEKIYNLYKAEKRYVKILHKILFVNNIYFYKSYPRIFIDKN